MKININTTYKKRLKYRIYDVVNGKRKLNCKGKFKGDYTINFQPEAEEIIVRVRKNNIAILFFQWLFTMFLGIFKRYGSPEILVIHIYNDVHILKINPDKDLLMFYRETVPNVTSPGGDADLTDNRAFYCTNYPSISEAGANKKINKVLKIVTISLLAAAILAVLAYGIYIRLAV